MMPRSLPAWKVAGTQFVLPNWLYPDWCTRGPEPGCVSSLCKNVFSLVCHRQIVAHAVSVLPMSLELSVCFPGLPVANICFFAWGVLHTHAHQLQLWKTVLLKYSKLEVQRGVKILPPHLRRPQSLTLGTLSKNTPAPSPWSQCNSETYILHYFQGGIELHLPLWELAL